MLDRLLQPAVQPVLRQIARLLRLVGVRPDPVSLVGFVVGLLAVPMIIMQWYHVALALILFNRFTDGIDGELARLEQSAGTDRFLDASLELIVYQAIVLGFGLAEPDNARWALLLMPALAAMAILKLAFMGVAEKRGLADLNFPHALDNLIGHSETIALFAALCLWPDLFPTLAMAFSLLCLAAIIARIVHGWQTLR